MRYLRYVALGILFVAPCLLHALDRQPTAIYHARRVALADKLNGGVAVLFANEAPALEYQDWRQDEDFYYLTGWNEPGAALVIEAPVAASPGHPARPYREVMLLPTRNPRMELYTGVKLDAATPGAAETAGVDNVAPLALLTSEINEVYAANRRTPLWGEDPSEPTKALATLAQNSLGNSGIMAINDVSAPIGELRKIKDAGEIALLQKAADASVKAQLAMMRSIHPGQKERTVQGIIYAALLANDCERTSYPSIIGSGIHSTELHYMEDANTMQAGDVVVVDAAGEYSMYASDITRTMPVNGHFTPRQREIYNIVLGAQKAAMDAFVAGKSRENDPNHLYPESLDTIAWNYMNEHGNDLHGEGLGKYFIHGIGHGVGIDVHDSLDQQPIQPGQVFTIEPGIYIPEEKIGVRIEDVFYASPDGKLIDLTAALPKTADEVEAIVQGKEKPHASE
jgi:Xaa-Pro aminopeptidase